MTENSDRPARGGVQQYGRDGLAGGHVIMLGRHDAASAAVAAYPGGLQVGGGVSAKNARAWLDRGASHVIVTSAVFRGGRIDAAALAELVAAVGRERIVLDLSCRRRPGDEGGPYYVVTDRWQKFTDVMVDAAPREFGLSRDESSSTASTSRACAAASSRTSSSCSASTRPSPVT